jgi:2,4-diketo-3-deoxy-L-fuconate hydrolase
MLDADGGLRDLRGVVADIGAASLADGSLERLRKVDVRDLPRVEGPVRLGSPITRPGKIVCVGLNYRAHAEESSMDVPAEPVLFMKATSSITGPTDPIRLPAGWSKVDWEVELGVVIGRTARNVTDAGAAACIAGYCLANDVSERAFQLERGGQWVKGKSCDTFAPLGPWLVTVDEVPDVQRIELSLDVNGERMQTGNTRQMIFPVTAVVSYISHFMTLEPGDVILTGTPPGVGLGQTPPRYLQPGDRITLTATGLGRQENVVVAPGDFAA